MHLSRALRHRFKNIVQKFGNLRRIETGPLIAPSMGMRFQKRFIIAIFALIGWLAFAPAAHGGINLRVCGQIKLEPSYKPNQKDSNFALYTESFRFELIGQFLPAQALREIKKLYAQVGNSGQVLFGCAQSAFAGAFSWSGFAGKEIKVSELSLVPNESLESLYSFERQD